MNIRHTPGTVAAPFGPYSHAVEVREGRQGAEPILTTILVGIAVKAGSTVAETLCAR